MATPILTGQQRWFLCVPCLLGFVISIACWHLSWFAASMNRWLSDILHILCPCIFIALPLINFHYRKSYLGTASIFILTHLYLLMHGRNSKHLPLLLPSWTVTPYGPHIPYLHLYSLTLTCGSLLSSSHTYVHKLGHHPLPMQILALLEWGIQYRLILWLDTLTLFPGVGDFHFCRTMTPPLSIHSDAESYWFVIITPSL